MAASNPVKHRIARNLSSIDRKNRNFPVKRHRTPADDDSEPTSKQFLSEEKMAARLGQLSISNDHSYSSNVGFNPRAKPNFASFHELERRLGQGSSDEESDDEGPTSKEVTVEITPELRNYLKKEQSVLPDSITKKLNQPCQALMLWTPPIVMGGEISSVWKDSGVSASKDDEDTSSSDNSGTMETDPTTGSSKQNAVPQLPRGTDVFAARNGVRTIAEDDIEVISQGIDISEEMGSESVDDMDSIPDGVVSHDSAVSFSGRASQHNGWHVPRNLLMAASELVDNNNDPGAIDIEGMNIHLQRHVPRTFPQINNQPLPVIGMGVNVAFDSVDDDIDL